MLRRTRSALSCEGTMKNGTAQRATSPSQHSFQGFANPSQFPTELLFSTIYVLSLPIIPGLPVFEVLSRKKLVVFCLFYSIVIVV